MTKVTRQELDAFFAAECPHEDFVIEQVGDGKATLRKKIGAAGGHHQPELQFPAPTGSGS